MVDMSAIRIVLADDHPQVRGCLRRIVERAADIVVVGEASNGYQAIRQVEELCPDVLVLDVEMPGLSGVQVTQRLRAGLVKVSILILSAIDDEQFIRAALASGASGYLVKDEAVKELAEAVRSLASGEVGWTATIKSKSMVSHAPRAIRRRRTGQPKPVSQRLSF